MQAMERELADAKQMLAQSTGHSVMRQKIEKQKKTTRDALSYVAELKRERSIFQTPSKSSISPNESVSQIDEGEVEKESEKTRLREEKLMMLLERSESKK